MRTPVSETGGGSSCTADLRAVTPKNGAARMLVMIIVGGVATGMSFLAIGTVGEVAHLPAEFASMTGGNLSGEQHAAITAAHFEVARKNATLWIALSGAILGGLFCLTIGSMRRAGARVALGVIAGLVVGGAFGAVAGFSSMSLNRELKANLSGRHFLPEHQIMLMHGVTWGLVGVGVGLAVGLSSRQVRFRPVLMSTVAAGVLGALGGIAFPIVCGTVAPLVNTSLPIPMAVVGRLIWIGLPSAAMGIGLARLA